MKTVTVTHPTGKWRLKVNVAGKIEVDRVLRAAGIDPRKSRILRVPKGVKRMLI